MNKSLVSVIVPVYKVEKYLDKCIESIVGQTYFNLEIILVDDGSSDNSPEICDAWAQKNYDKSFSVIAKEILAYKHDILKNKRLGLKFKISVLMLSLSPELFVKVNRKIRQHG